MAEDAAVVVGQREHSALIDHRQPILGSCPQSVRVTTAGPCDRDLTTTQ